MFEFIYHSQETVFYFFLKKKKVYLCKVHLEIWTTLHKLFVFEMESYIVAQLARNSFCSQEYKVGLKL